MSDPTITPLVHFAQSIATLHSMSQRWRNCWVGRIGAAAATVFAVALVGFLAHPAVSQSLLQDALKSDKGPSADAGESAPANPEDPLREIDSRLADARQRHAALEGAQTSVGDGEAFSSSENIEWSRRLIRVLEQRREAKIRSDALTTGREAIESALARDPSELFGDPPPFPVPILDGVMKAWSNAVEREQQHAVVLKDRRANAKLAQEVVDDLEKERRRLREVLDRSDNDLDRVRVEGEIRSIDDQLPVGREQVALALQRVANAEIEHEIKEIATRQALAARAWIESHLAPAEDDLADAIERIDRKQFDLEREIDLARSRVLDADANLRAVEERRRDSAEGASPARDAERLVELATRRQQLSHRQHLVAILNQQIERLGRMRTTWQRRYAVLGDSLDLSTAPDWLTSTEQQLELLTRNRRIEEAELANLQLNLAELLRQLAEGDTSTREIDRWRRLEIDDLEALIAFYKSDLDALDDSIELEQRLRAELLARLSDRDLGERVRGAFDSLQDFWSFEITTSEDSPITPGKIIIAILVIMGGYFVAGVLMRWLGRRLFPRLGFDAGASNAFASLAFYGILAIVFLLALRAVNIPLTAFAVAGGALALGIGFGSQAIMSNFISGLLLLAERPIRMGDLIEVGGVVGSVESIGLRSTRIRTPDNFHIIVPNSSFLESNVINWTHEDPMIRIRVGVGVAYGSPTGEVKRVLLQAASEHPQALRSPAPAVYFEEFGESALIFEVRFWLRYDETVDRSAVRSDLRFRIDELFAENGIVIAFPQLDVHLDTTTAVAPGDLTKSAKT